MSENLGLRGILMLWLTSCPTFLTSSYFFPILLQKVPTFPTFLP